MGNQLLINMGMEYSFLCVLEELEIIHSLAINYTFEFHHLIHRWFPMVSLDSHGAIVVLHQRQCATHLYLHTFAQRQAHYGPMLDKIFVNWHHRRRLGVQMNLHTNAHNFFIRNLIIRL